MKFYFARHGESEANLLREFSNRGYKHGLTEKGRSQAVELAARLRPAGISQIYTSPLQRAVQTAEILSECLSIGFKITDALREYDTGITEGRSDPASWELYWQVRMQWSLGQWGKRIEGGESFLDMKARFVPFIQRLLAAPDDPERRLVLIGHGGLYACMLPVVLDNVTFAFTEKAPFPNTGYVLAATTQEGLRCIDWCGVSPGRGEWR